MSTQGWHPEDIKAALRKRYGQLATFSESLGLHRASVSIVIRNPLSSTKTEAKIAAALGVTPHELWPQRWSSDGKPLPRLARINRILPHVAAHRQNGGGK